MDMILRIALHGEYLRFPSTLEHNVFQNHRHNCSHVNFGEGSLLWLKVIKFSLIALIVNRLIQEINFQNAHTSKNFAFFVLVNWHWNVEIYFLNTKSNTQKKCPSKKSVNYCSNAIINFEKGTRILKLYIYIYMSFDILSFWIHHNGEMIVQRELNYFNEQNNLRE